MKEVQDIVECYGALAQEETVLFNRRESWNSEDALDEKYREYLMPTSNRYFSRLRPLFSFEVKTLSSLNNFSHILFRDGILFLLKFFIRFKKPTDLRCKILIHADLAAIVPPAWMGNILLYRIVALHDIEKPISEVVIHITPDTYENEASVIEEVKLIQSKHDEGTQFRLLPSVNSLRGEDYLNYCRYSSFSIVDAIKEELGGKSCRLLRLDDFWSKNFTGVQFYNCKGSRVFTMDSFLTHHVLSNGGRVFGVNSNLGVEQVVNLSPHHAMSVSEHKIKESCKLSKFLFEELGYPKAKLFSSEPADIRGLDDYFKVFYYSKDLLKLSRYINSGLVK